MAGAGRGRRQGAASARPDLRFELENGTKLDHELERYDAERRLGARLGADPELAASGQLRLVLYYGKPTLTAAEANPSWVWRGYLSVLDARTGADRSGANRALTPTGIGTGALLGDAGAYSGPRSPAVPMRPSCRASVP